MPLEKFSSKKPYISIVEGTLKQKVSEDTPGAEKRNYKLQNGTEGTKYELTYKSIRGHVQDIRIKEGEYGEMLEVEFEDCILTINTESRYFIDFAKKLAKADINDEIKVSPFDFISDGKQLKGVSIYQNGQKLKNYYYDEVMKSNVNGFPSPQGDIKKLKKDDWKMYWISVKKFLIEELNDIRDEIVKKEDKNNVQEEIPTIHLDEEPIEENPEEVKLEDVPF